MMVFGERELGRLPLSYMDCYNGTHTHLSLNKDAPISRTPRHRDAFCAVRLHHQYARG
jgi:hypothetical protein